MPRGKPLPNLMHEEVVQYLYHCVKNIEGQIKFDEVAKQTGMKDAAAAQAKFRRVLQAQEKIGPGAGNDGKKAARGTKRKADKMDGNGGQSNGALDSEEAAAGREVTRNDEG